MNAKKIMKFKRARTASEVAKAHSNSNYTDGQTVDDELKKLEEAGLLIKEYSAADIGADPARIGFPGSPTKVKQVRRADRQRSEIGARDRRRRQPSDSRTY